ncbi:MAG TPA: dienelactone hydrolase family protein [Acetobacteraceae bacterium]|nr:dienelactone hydrolase family protein [Acetobacteraceae bacterium]
MTRILLLAILLLLPAAPAMSVHIVDPWPDLPSVRGVQQEAVTFRSSDPFVPAAIPRAPARTVSGLLFLPADAGPNHATPAVVMLHGSAGMIADRAKYGPQLAAMGVAVLLVKTYDSRRDLGTGFIERVLNITETMFVADAYAALRYLTARPEIDPRRVVLAGFSYGGMAAEYAMYAQIADALAPNGPRFAGHVAFYAPCIARFADSRTTGAPLLMLYGAEDELIRPDRCAQVAEDLRAGGSEVEIIAYPGAVHQWDGGMPRQLIGRQLAGCRFRVERDGTVRDENTRLPMSGPFLRKVILGLCVGSRPYPIGRDDAVRAQSNRDFGAFLARVFGRGARG